MGKLDGWVRWACRIAAWLGALVMGAPILRHVATGSRAYLGFFEDDFFYYATVADRFVQTGRLTYDGVHLTNGFHPLWMIFVAGARWLTGGVGPSFAILVTALGVIAVLATFELGARLLVALGVRPLVAWSSAAILTGPLNHLAQMGMETTLTVLCLTGLLLALARTESPSLGRSALLGFLSSLAILARIDVIICVAALVLGWLFLDRRPLRARVATALGFSLGGVLVPLYVSANLFFFGKLLPLSGAAKQIVTRPGFNVEFLVDALNPLLFGYKLGPLCVLGAACLVSRAAPPRARWVAVVAFVYPVAYYVTYAALSPWIYFRWYAFAVFPAVLLSYGLLAELAARWLSRPALHVGLGVVLALAVLRVPVVAARNALDRAYRFTKADNSLVAMAEELAQRMRGLPGTYAMGDKAGIAVFLLDHPVVQLEGLMADAKMLEHIRAQDRLEPVLREYGVSYLIVSISDTDVGRSDGCYDVVHPNPDEAGARAAKMTGHLCRPPIIEFDTPAGGHPWSRFPKLRTYVFDVRPAG